jgi:Zn-dependent protease
MLSLELLMELTLIQKIAIWILPLLFAITLHEVAHGWVASKFGDQTARLAGRLTLNPWKHVDLVGTILVPLILLTMSNFIFGWAKPVPVDARNLRRPRFDMIWVALAGPFANLLMALFWAGIAKLGAYLMMTQSWLGLPLNYMGEAGIMINIVLAVLNCIPIPPLDGSRVLMGLLPRKIAYGMSRLEPFGFIILVILLMTGVLSYVMLPIVSYLMRLTMTVFGLA